MSQRIVTVGTIMLVGLLHLPAVLFDWYFYFWWYDVMMHALGGVAMGFLACVLWDMLQDRAVQVFSWKQEVVQCMFVLGFVALIGIGWEWFEGIVDAVLLPRLGMADSQLGLVDTMFDLYFDLFGGLIAWILVKIGARQRAT